jgi:hypothetical protein
MSKSIKLNRICFLFFLPNICPQTNKKQNKKVQKQNKKYYYQKQTKKLGHVKKKDQSKSIEYLFFFQK